MAHIAHKASLRLRPLLAAMAAGTALLLGGCVVAPVDPGYGYNVYGSPPPPYAETVTVSPGPAYVWTSGLWVWGGSRYNWRPGYWGHPGHRGPPPGRGWRGGYR